MEAGTWLSCGSVSHCSLLSCTFQNPILKSFRTISSFSTDSCYPLLPASNESSGTKPVKIGKGYAWSDLGKQDATFRELKLSFSHD